MPPPLLAFGKEPGPLRKALEFILSEALADPTRSDIETIGLVIPIESESADWADQAAAIVNRHPKCVGLVVVCDACALLYEHLSPGLRGSFCQSVFFTGTHGHLLDDILQKASEIEKRRPSSAAMHRAREVVFANALFRRMKDFSHGGTKDITNQLFAPLRLRLLRDGNSLPDNNFQSELDDFGSSVLKDADKLGALGVEIKDAFCRFRSALQDQLSCNDEIERIMDLLTECRKYGGESVPLVDREEEEKLAPARQNNSKGRYHILVVDDHSEHWKLFFEELRPEVGRILKVEAEQVVFNYLALDEGPLVAHALAELPDNDAVLLDIFLQQDVDGLSILESIRRHYVNVPVILWTTSREIDLPAEARLANAFLFKKTSTRDHIARVLARQVREGRARRLYPIPGHFFDQSILDEASRKCALRFTEYCSKQLDSFHALDEGFFRYFTDHGGRHLFKLLEYLGAILRPLVDDISVFSEVPRQCEDEVLALYLSVFLHEFGMLRLQGPNEPNWPEMISKSNGDKALLAAELNLVRNLHAVRGMVLLAKDPGDEPNGPNDHWPDEEGQHQAKKRLVPRGAVQSAVAVITGHHSRLLPLNCDDSGAWNHSFSYNYKKKVHSALEDLDDLQRESLKLKIDTRFYAEDEVRRVLDSLTTRNQCPDHLKRLRKHCALFRFVDAIDVDQTRNPARFLCIANKISPRDRRETLKRQVIRKVTIQGGTVDMQTNVPPPCIDLVYYILTIEAKLGQSTDKLVELLSVPNLKELLNIWITDPWSEPCNASRELKIVCQKAIDGWLERFWQQPKTAEEALRDALPKDRICNRKELKLQLASVTALSVAWEILDEYQAIVDCALTNKVKLGHFWRDTKKDGAYCFRSQEKMLAILFHPKDGLDAIPSGETTANHVVHSTSFGEL